ncbi:MAG: L-histidine N(alpha)-methyltransferase [Thermoanaerobaculales bacterium]|jgi:L-histidine N-alpha-methyltransferase|nr:L-histidine N(alpha)-methyltransferase [Thermoanaerobaculales bacterium]
MQRSADASVNLTGTIVRGPFLARDPREERADVHRNLLRRLPRIDSRYFYDDAGSELFERITRLPEYYQSRTEEVILAGIADEVVASTGARELVELGSGSGRKVRLLLDAMQRRGRLDRCVLLDINESFLTGSVEALAEAYPEAEVRGVVGDFLSDLGAVGEGRRRLLVLLAGTIGNLYPRQLATFLRRVRALLGPNDAFLVGLDLVKDPARLEAAYNDSAGVTAEFNRNALRVLNQRFGTGFEIEAFEHVAFYDRERAWIEMRLRARRPTSASLGDGREIRFAAGDEIRTEISRKFTRHSFAAALDGTGLELAAFATDPAELFASALVRPVRGGGAS